MRAFSVASAVAFVALLTVGLAAQTRPTLHEYVAPPSAAEAGARIPSRDPSPPPAGVELDNPSAIRHGGRVLPAPAAGSEPAPGEVVHRNRDRDSTARPDYNTAADGVLHYSEVFNPSVVPFMRMSALDRVSADYQMGIEPAPPEVLPVGQDARAENDLFWGSLVIELRSGRDIPIPSVAPDMRILSYKTEPRVALEFLRDGAHNYSVRAKDEDAQGSVRLIFLADAPSGYFAPRMPRNLKLSDMARLVPPALATSRRIAGPARVAAEQVLARLGVRKDTPLDVTIDKLVTHFRAFTAGTPPEPSGNIYLDLALSQKGVCRHRAFAFMVTALAAGIPTRYITNEAHAFVEVWLPGGQGWARIDLGGAALELDVANAADKQMHRPRGEDPFAKPPEYTENYTQLRGDVRGLSDAQRAEAGRPIPESTGGGDQPTRPEPAPVTGAPVTTPPSDGRQRLVLSLAAPEREAFRGDRITASGTATGDDGPVAGLVIEIFFAPDGRLDRDARMIGRTTTRSDGKFSVALDLPHDLPVGDYTVHAYTEGDDRYAPAITK